MLITFKSHSKQRKESIFISHRIGPIGNPSLKQVFNFRQSYLRCLLLRGKSSVHPREDGRAAEKKSQDPFKKKFSENAHDTSV